MQDGRELGWIIRESKRRQGSWKADGRLSRKLRLTSSGLVLGCGDWHGGWRIGWKNGWRNHHGHTHRLFDLLTGWSL